MSNLNDLAARVEALTEIDPELNERVAEAFGWHVRLVTSLGINGRTPGRWLWFPPYPEVGRGRAKPPLFIGSRKRASTVVALRSRVQGEG